MSEYEGIYHIRKKKDGFKTMIVRSGDIGINPTDDNNYIKMTVGTDDDLVKLPPIFSVDIFIPIDKLDYVIGKLNEMKDKSVGKEVQA